MKFAWLLARRYLRSPNKPAVLRLVTALAVIGVAAGVATLVIALAMNTGFRLTLQDRLLGVTAHVNIQQPGWEGLADYFALAERLGRTPGVRAVAPAIYLTVLLSSGNRARGVVLKGIDPALEAKRNEALQHIVSRSGSRSGSGRAISSRWQRDRLHRDRQDTGRRIGIACGRLRFAHKSGRKADAIRNGAAIAALSYRWNF